MKEDHRSHKARQVLEGMRQRLTRQMVLTLTSCTHCGLCSDSCHYVLTNPGDPTYTPAHKADQIRKFFNRHVDWTGRVLPWWVRAQTLRNDEDLEQLKDTLFGKCTNCRRCTINCPMGVDFATVNRMVRGLLVSVGIMPEGVAVVSKDQWEMGNQMGVLPEEYLETLDWMDEEVRDELGIEHRLIAMDKMDADFMYTVNPREIKYDPRTIADATKIFTLAGENWTMASEGWDMTNFGLFSGDDALGGTVAGRVYEKAKELRARRVVISECGHGYRSTRCEGSNWNGVEAGVQMESAIVTMIRYAYVDLDKTYVLWVCCILLGTGVLAAVGYYEKRRDRIRAAVREFRRWEH